MPPIPDLENTPQASAYVFFCCLILLQFIYIYIYIYIIKKSAIAT